MLWSSIVLSADFKAQLENLSRDELNALDSKGNSLLSYSLMHKDNIVVEYLLKDLGLDPNIHANSLTYESMHNGKEVVDKSPMWKAALQNSNAVNANLRLLNQYGADLNDVDEDGMSALTWSIYNSKSVLPLLPYVDLNKKASSQLLRYRGNHEKQTPLSIAIARKKVADAIMLIEAGADTGIDGVDTALHMAVVSGETAIIDTLLKKGVAVDMVNKWGITPLYLAIILAKTKVVELLLSANPDTVFEKPYCKFGIGHAILFSVLYATRDCVHSFENIRDLMSIFPDAVTSANKEQLIIELKTHGLRLLQEVIKVIDSDREIPENALEDPYVIQAFKVLEHTSSILTEYHNSSQSCLKNGCADSQIPLVFYASIKGDAVLLSRLLKENPSLVNLGYKGLTLLGMSLLFANKECAKLLMSNEDIDLNIKNHEGDNVLASSATMQDFSIIEDLLSRGVDIDSVNDQYISAADTILYQFRSRDKYQNAVDLVKNYSKDPMHSLLSMGKNYTNYQLDQSKSNVVIVVASGFWSPDPFAMARRAVAQHRGLQVFVITKDQAEEGFLNQFNGFVIPGGGDSFPEKQEFVMSDIGHMSEGESLYKHVLSIADKNSIPVMGMCLGNQYIGLYGGATLYPSKGHNRGNHKGRFVRGTLPHFMSLSAKEQQHVLDSKHYPDINFSIDTAHNFAVVANKPGNVKIGAFSEVGVVQSISYNNHVIGFQFHPEHYYGTEGSGEHIARATNLINNFMLLAFQHSQWHNFAKTNGFVYQEAQNALQYSNDALLDVIKFGTLAQCRVLDKNSKEWGIENLAKSNVTYVEFSWPSPGFDAFPQGECEVSRDVCKTVVDHNGADRSFATAIYVPADYELGGNTVCYIGDQA